MDVSKTIEKRSGIGHGTPGPGRPKGTIDKRHRAGVEFASAALARHPQLVDDFLSSEDERIRFDCWKLLNEYAHGKPIQRLEVNLEDEARTWAERAGVTPDELIAQSRAMVDEAMN